MQPFDYKGVELLVGPLKSQVDEIRNDYLRIPEDSLLKGFRQRAGLPAPGADLGGWYSGDVFHVFGQILSGLARMYAATGDPACKKRAESLVHQWALCIAPDGYFYFSKSPNARHYTYEKTVGGLVDMIDYCNSAEARTSLSRITDWAEKNLSRRRQYAFNAGDGDTEWYTLSENLYRAYLATGDERYRTFAKVWEYTDYWNIYARKGDIFGKRPDGGQTGGYHAYSHVNTLAGLGAGFLVTGDQHYLDTLVNAYDDLQAKQCFATGGFGPNELLAPRAALERMIGDTHNTFETQCGSWAGFKLCKYLISCTGDARYGDWVEKLIINGIGASPSMTTDGKVFYYSDYNTSGATKKNMDTGWTCCTGTRPQAAADYFDQIYFHTTNTLAVSQYIPSTVTWSAGSKQVKLQQTTRFPAEPQSQFTIESKDAVRWTLELRVPGWLSAPMTAEVNGKQVHLAVGADHWARLERTWKHGDKLTVHFPMKLSLMPMDPVKPYPYAVLYGPTALALENTPEALKAIKQLTGEQLVSSLKRDSSHTLTFESSSNPSLKARPFYAYAEGESYLLYLDPTAPNRTGYRAFKYSDGWNDSGQFRFINRVGATVEAPLEVTKEGGGIRWLGFKYDDAGRAQVEIDGKVIEIVDQYGPGRDLPFDWRKTGLSVGKHTIRLTLLGDKNAAAKDRYINVAGFEVLDK